MSRMITIAVPNDLKRKYLLESIRKRLIEFYKNRPTVRVIQSTLSQIRVEEAGQVVAQYLIVIVPITIGIEQIQGCRPVNVTLLLKRLNEIKAELMFMASDPMPTPRTPTKMADWNLDEAHSG